MMKTEGGSSARQLGKPCNIDSKSSDEILKRLERGVARQVSRTQHDEGKRSNSKKRSNSSIGSPKTIKTIGSCPNLRASASRTEDNLDSSSCHDMKRESKSRAHGAQKAFGGQGALFELIADAKDCLKSKAQLHEQDMSLISMNTDIDDEEDEEDDTVSIDSHHSRKSSERRRGPRKMSPRKTGKKKSPKRSLSGDNKFKVKSRSPAKKPSRSLSPRSAGRSTKGTQPTQCQEKKSSSRSLSPMMMRKGTHEKAEYTWKPKPHKKQERPQETDTDFIDLEEGDEDELCQSDPGTRLRIGRDAATVFRRRCSSIERRREKPSRRRYSRASMRGRSPQKQLPCLATPSIARQPINPWIHQLEMEHKESLKLQLNKSIPDVKSAISNEDDRSSSPAPRRGLERDQGKRKVRASTYQAKRTSSGIQHGTYRNLISA